MTRSFRNASVGFRTAKDILKGLPGYVLSDYRYTASQHPRETWADYARGLRHPDWTTPAQPTPTDAALYVTEADRINDTGGQSS